MKAQEFIARYDNHVVFSQEELLDIWSKFIFQKDIFEIGKAQKKETDVNGRILRQTESQKFKVFNRIFDISWILIEVQCNDVIYFLQPKEIYVNINSDNDCIDKLYNKIEPYININPKDKNAKNLIIHSSIYKRKCGKTTALIKLALDFNVPLLVSPHYYEYCQNIAKQCFCDNSLQLVSDIDNDIRGKNFKAILFDDSVNYWTVDRLLKEYKHVFNVAGFVK